MLGMAQTWCSADSLSDIPLGWQLSILHAPMSRTRCWCGMGRVRGHAPGSDPHVNRAALQSNVQGQWIHSEDPPEEGPGQGNWAQVCLLSMAPCFWHHSLC